jgi:hypothetical protein
VLSVLRFRAYRLLDWAKFSEWRVDVAEETIGQALPTVTGFGARLTIAVLKRRNVAPASILGRAGLSEQTLIVGSGAFRLRRRASVLNMQRRRLGEWMVEGAEAPLLVARPHPWLFAV